MLTSSMNSRAKLASASVSLTECARESSDKQLEVLIDGNGLVHLIGENVMSKKGLAAWEWILGGEYGAMDAAVREKIGAMQRGGLKPVVCFDAAKGMKSGSENDWKKHEDARRFAQRCDKIAGTLMMLHEGKDALRQWQNADWMGSARSSRQLYALASWQVQSTLLDLGIECITFQDEADTEMVKECKRRGAFAVIGADSDFFIIQVGIWIRPGIT